MTKITRGEEMAFRASIIVCLAEISSLVSSGKILSCDLKRTISELSCMKTVIERDCGLTIKRKSVR